MAPLITVYLVNFNYSEYISKAIDSVLDQSFTDFELIIIDDGSTDNSVELISNYTDKRITTIFQHNRGLNVTNNIALRRARGKYIIRLDADDWFDARALQIMVEMLEQEQNLAMVFPDYFTVSQNGEIVDLVRRHDFSEVTIWDQPAHGACTMIRTEALRSIGGYNEKFTRQDGYELWFRFIKKYEINNINLPLFYYRQHANSLTRNENKLLETRSEIISNVADKIAENNDKTVAIIPARGGDSALDFELREVGSRPLIDWTITHALTAKKIDTVLFTSADQNLIDYVFDKFGHRVIGLLRGAELALENSNLNETIKHALAFLHETHGLKHEIVSMLFPDAPFRDSKFIDNAVDILKIFDTDTVIGVRPETDLLYTHDGNGMTPIQNKPHLRLEAEEIYRKTGGLQVFRASYFNKTGKHHGGKVGHLLLNEKASFVIRSELSWQIANSIATILER